MFSLLVLFVVWGVLQGVLPHALCLASYQGFGVEAGQQDALSLQALPEVSLVALAQSLHEVSLEALFEPSLEA